MAAAMIGHNVTLGPSARFNKPLGGPFKGSADPRLHRISSLLRLLSGHRLMAKTK
jgi:hypothetical protein